MLLKIALYGNPILRKKAEPVTEITDELRKFVQDLFETMDVGNGIGLAAPQVSESIRIFVTQVPILQEDDTWAPGTQRVFINPKIISVSEETEVHGEGCLSIPEVYGDVERPIEVTVEAMNIDGEIIQATYIGLEARCILHENDHINGKLFIDRMDKAERQKIEQKLREIKSKQG